MNDTSLISFELIKAARSLDDRFQILHVPSYRIPETEWSLLPVAVQLVIPRWIMALLLNYSLAGGVLEYRDRTKPYIRQFAFFEPSDYAKSLQEGSLLLRLVEFGFLAFANEANGNVWLTRVHGGSNSPIHLLELSDWNGYQPTKQNGLIFASGSLALLMASMGVSEASFYNSSDIPSSVLWHREGKLNG